MNRHAMVFAALAGLLSAALAGEVGPPIEVAPQAKETRDQNWASAAWSDGGKCWLVAWKEGCLGEPASDVWCARVSADGKALDPAGVKLTSGQAFSDRPRVASDGKGFLVVWEEMAEGKDWNVFGATVSAEGTSATAGKPFLVAGGEHNQCRPAVAFAKGGYHVLWMGYDGGAYGIYGTRVSPDGRPLGDKPAVVTAIPSAAGKTDNVVNAILPAIAANQAGELLSAFHVRDSYRKITLARMPIDAATGQPTGTALKTIDVHPFAKTTGASGTESAGWRERTAALAMGPDGAIMAITVKPTRTANDFIVGRLSKTGDVLGLQEVAAPSLSITNAFKPISTRFAAAPVGKGFLVVGDVLNAVGDKKQDEFYARVIGWPIGADGSAKGEPFAVAGEAGRECVLPEVAPGAGDSCLVVYSEIRGADDVKVLARLVK